MKDLKSLKVHLRFITLKLIIIDYHN